MLILDEAVSALDKSVEAQVLNLLLDLKDEFGLSYIFISHDLEVVRFVASRVLVMYLGRVAEVGPTEALYTGSRHPYTTALLGSMLSMDPDRPHGTRRRWPAIRRTRSIRRPAAASTRAARLRKAVCSAADPALAACRRRATPPPATWRSPGPGHSKASREGRMSIASKPILEIENLDVTFTGGAKPVRAVAGVNLSLGRGEVIALLGESGSGKSVTLRSILRLHPEKKTKIVRPHQGGRYRRDGPSRRGAQPASAARPSP